MPNHRFLHTADWQLGMTRHFLGSEAQARFTAARVDAVRRIGKLADDLACSFVVVCGDVFESNQIDRQVLVRALDAMRSVKVPLYLLPGNHDPLDAASVYRSSTFRRHAPHNVHVLRSYDPVEAAPGVWLLPAPWPNKRPLEDLTARSLRGASGCSGTRVLVGHGIVDALSPDAADPALIELPRLEQAVVEGQLAFVALGDRHSVTDIGDSGRVWYSGAPEATDYDELDAGQVLAVELSDADGHPVHVARHQVGEWRFVREVRALNTGADIDRLASELDAREAKDRTVLKLGFEGTINVTRKAQLDALLAHCSDLFAGIEWWSRKTDLTVLPEDADFVDLGLSGFVADALDDLRETAAGTGADRTAAQDALALLVRFAGGYEA